jgi:hypothetical protein
MACWLVMAGARGAGARSDLDGAAFDAAPPSPAVAGPPEVLAGPYVGACGSHTDLATSCTTGAHVRGGTPLSGLFHSVHDVAYTGTLESRLMWSGGERVLRCDLPNGPCSAGGSFPPEGEAFVHTCASYARGTTSPGGSGAWACRLQHDVPLVG